MQTNEQASRITDNSLLVEVLNEMSAFIIIIDEEMKIVFANKSFLEYAKTTLDRVLGKKPGDVIKCRYASASTKGCGYGRQCKHCNVRNTIVEVISSGIGNEEPVTIVSLFEGLEVTLNLHEKVSVISNGGEKLYMVAFVNRDSEIVKNNLQRIFYHDILNSASSIYNIIEYLKLENHELSLNRDVMLLESSIELMIEEIKYQKSISDAENNKLDIMLEKINIVTFINECIELLKKDEQFKKFKIKTESSLEEIFYDCDKVILRRVVINLLKNALEESSENSPITVQIDMQDEDIQIRFKNDSVMSEKVKKRIFTKGFSTKGSDRGFGLYGSKLLANKYLNGDICFVSNEKDGTVFTISLCGGNQ